MSIYELTGGFLIVFLACVGLAVISILAAFGLYRLLERLEIGRMYEDAGVRDALAKPTAELVATDDGLRIERRP